MTTRAANPSRCGIPRLSETHACRVAGTSGAAYDGHLSPKNGKKLKPHEDEPCPNNGGGIRTPAGRGGGGGTMLPDSYSILVVGK